MHTNTKQGCRTATWPGTDREDSLQKLRPVGMTIRNVLLAICLLVLCGILVAGLWPFHAPLNQVSWSKGSNGVLFGKHGTIVSASPFEAGASQGRQFLQSGDMAGTDPGRFRGHDSRVLLAGQSGCPVCGAPISMVV